MAKNTLRCPECAALLTLGSPVEPGKRIRCPKCEAVFDVPDSEADTAAAAAYGVTRKPKRHHFKSKKQGSQVGAIVAIVAVAGFLLAGAIVGGYFLFKGKGGGGGFAARPAPADAKVGLEIGNIAQEIEGEDIDGVRFKLSDYRGKIVVLDFWGQWCVHCRAMFPHERSLVQKLEGKPFVLLGVNSDPDRNTAKEAVASQKLNWRSFWNGSSGPSGPISSSWRVRGWPTLYVIDDRGVIREKFEGGGKRVEADIDRAIEMLLKEMGAS